MYLFNLPFVRLGNVTLRVRNCGNAIEATNGKNHIIYYFKTEIAARMIHFAYERPSLCIGIVTFACGETRGAIKTAYHIELTTKSNT